MTPLRDLLDVDSRWLRVGLQAGSGLIVAVLLFAVGWTWYRSQEARGMAAFADASSLVDQAEAPQADPEARQRAVTALEALIAAHPRLSAIPQAAYELGNLKYRSGQLAQARAAYELALARGASGSVKALAQMGVGYTWEAEKNYGNAARAFEAAGKGLSAKDFMYEEALMAQARALDLAGKSGAALDIYQRLAREQPQGRYADELRNRIASLKTRTSP